jgi:hypothetical protein
LGAEGIHVGAWLSIVPNAINFLEQHGIDSLISAVQEIRAISVSIQAPARPADAIALPPRNQRRHCGLILRMGNAQSLQSPLSGP